MIASEGPPVSNEVANSAPIIDTSAPELGQLSDVSVPGSGVPPGAMTAQDILLSKLFWPWGDMGAQNVPERWLYMSPYVQGVIAQLAVQTPAGPKLVNADSSGRIALANYYDRNPKSIQLSQYADLAAHGFTLVSRYDVPAGRKAVIESVHLGVTRTLAAGTPLRAQALATVSVAGVAVSWEAFILNNTVGAHDAVTAGQAGFLSPGDFIYIADEDDSIGGQCHYIESVRLTEFDG